ncbi:unnamed protein product [Litomosoides sigmodontis]|uniref:Chondroitin proteoglycan 4 domain-containing protein n=1 Tax=Litomosoides sigmodontis TaxID=42156 RepID=A0A3P6SXS2_LITSI|nr:unnamed protein product [Litomosoides sigmodontis]
MVTVTATSLAILLLVNFSITQLSLALSSIFDQVITHGKSEFDTTKILTGADVRTCSCDEQHTCIKEMKSQAANCFSPCFLKFQQITNQLEDLKACFHRKQQVIVAFFSCFENNINSCVSTKNGPRIPKTNITELLRVIALSITKNVRNMANVITPSINTIIDTASEFASCVKDCFLDENRDGFCFDRSDCQPSLVVAKARKTLKKCSHSINWKKELGEFCKCAVNAGLSKLENYCAVFEIIAARMQQKIRQHQ